MVWPQTDADARRFTRLGVKFMLTLGNLKYDQQPDAEQLAQGQALKARLPKPVLLLASSRQGEEAAPRRDRRGRPATPRPPAAHSQARPAPCSESARARRDGRNS